MIQATFDGLTFLYIQYSHTLFPLTLKTIWSILSVLDLSLSLFFFSTYLSLPINQSVILFQKPKELILIIISSISEKRINGSWEVKNGDDR